MLVEIVHAPGALGIEARPAPNSGHAAQFLAGYLNADLQGDAAHARDVLAHVDQALAGQGEDWSESGNAYLVSVSPTGASLEFHWAEDDEPDSASLGLTELRAGLLAWIAALALLSTRADARA